MVDAQEGDDSCLLDVKEEKLYWGGGERRENLATIINTLGLKGVVIH